MALVVGILLAVFVFEGAWAWVAVAAGGAIEFAEAYGWWRWTHHRRPAVGVETLIGEDAVVTDDGWVRIRGELWRARGTRPLRVGERVQVREVDGLTLVVG